MKKFKMLIVLCCIAAFLPACGLIIKKLSISRRYRILPVDCETAEADIKVLTDEKADVAKQIAAGVISLAPPALVMGILTGTEKSKIEMAVGHYNKLIDIRIAKIKTDCGLE